MGPTQQIPRLEGSACFVLVYPLTEGFVQAKRGAEKRRNEPQKNFPRRLRSEARQ
jgi:hypothetical protein